MQKIFKYELEVTDLQTLNLPDGAKILSVLVQRGQLVLYAQVEPAFDNTPRVIEIIGTGNPMSSESNLWQNRTFIGTVSFPVTDDVYHVFERSRL